MALLSALGAAYNIFLVINLPAYHDAPILHFAAYRIINGDIPYRDFLDTNFPATYFIHWLIWIVFGDNDLGLMLLDIIAMMSFCTFFCLFFGKKFLWESLLIFGFILTYHYTNNPSFFAQRDVIMMPFLMGAVYFSHRATFLSDKKNFLLFGALIAFASFIKPIALILLILIFAFNFRNYCWSGFLWTIQGGLIVTLPFILLMTVTNSLAPFLKIVFEFLPSYSHWGRTPVNYYDLCIRVIIFSVMLFSISGFYTQKSLLVSKRILFLGIFYSYSIIHATIQKNWFYHVYLSELLQIIIALYLIFLFSKQNSFFSLLIICCLVPILYYYSPLQKPSYDIQSIESLTHSVEKDVAQSKLIFEQLHLTKPRTILALDFATNVHRAAYKSGLKPASNMIYTYCFYNTLLHNDYLNKSCEAFYNDMIVHMPDIIIYSNNSWPLEWSGKTYASQNPAFVTIISNNYEKFIERTNYVIFVKKS